MFAPAAGMHRWRMYQGIKHRAEAMAQVFYSEKWHIAHRAISGKRIMPAAKQRELMKLRE